MISSSLFKLNLNQKDVDVSEKDWRGSAIFTFNGPRDYNNSIYENIIPQFRDIYHAIDHCQTMSDLKVLKSLSGRTDPEAVLSELLLHRGVLVRLKKSRSQDAVRLKKKLKDIGFYI